MSLRAILWALHDAPVDDPTDALILVAYADNARDDGTCAWPGHEEVARRARCSLRTVQRRVPMLVEAGLLLRGDQQLVAHVRADRRPVVYDLPLSLTRPAKLTGRESDGPSAATATARQPRRHGVTPVADEPIQEPAQDEPVPLFAEAAPPPSASDRPESRSKRVNRLARHVCDSSSAVKARGFWRWKESVDGIVIAHEDASDDQVLAALRVLLQSGLAINRDNAIRAYEGTLTVGRRVDNRHRDAVAADDPEQQARRAAWS